MSHTQDQLELLNNIEFLQGLIRPTMTKTIIMGVMCVTQYSLPDNITSAHNILSVQKFSQIINPNHIQVTNKG